jgi:hypothetical protein
MMISLQSLGALKVLQHLPRKRVNNAIAAMEAEEVAKAAAKVAAKESAKAKLEALGLSDEEIAAITNN